MILFLKEKNVYIGKSLHYLKSINNGFIFLINVKLKFNLYLKRVQSSLNENPNHFKINSSDFNNT